MTVEIQTRTALQLCPSCRGNPLYTRFASGENILARISCTKCGLGTKTVGAENPPGNSGPVFEQLARVWNERQPVRAKPKPSRGS